MPRSWRILLSVVVLGLAGVILALMVVSPATLLVQGTIAGVEADGTRRPAESGVWHVSLLVHGALEVRTVTVIEGRWELEVPRGSRLVPGGMNMGGRPAIIQGPEQMPVARRMDLEARYCRPATLRVLDRSTGEELSDVSVVRLGGPPGRPPLEEVVLEGAASPLELPASLGHQWYRVSTPGHQAARVKVSHHQGGEYRVELEPGER